jgi:glutamate synthase domain-containing protein 2
MFEFISPEIQQYFIETSTDGRPFSRNHRSLIYRRAKNVNDTVPFGTQNDLEKMEYEGLRHSIYAKEPNHEDPRVIIGGPECKHPYSASIYNISAMSFGALSKNAIMALNKGAKKGNFYHNTGEGGLSPYHLQGGDVVWQIGTGYFGCRTNEGRFNPGTFREQAAKPEVKMIELKISQGAKPGHGGVLPAVKNSEEIAAIRHLEPHTTVISPPGHKEFSDAKGLLAFIEKLRELSGGKPVGFKLCIGKTEEFTEICQVMVETGMMPDFITVDGAEGGTGAAPLEFSDSVGMPLQPALIFVNKTLIKYNLRDKIRIIASGKIVTAEAILKNLALGADLCNSARGYMFAIGCIQALRCNTNQCPTGVATQDPALVKGLVVSDKAERAYQFHYNTIYAVMELLAACGKEHISEVDMGMFVRGDEFVTLANRYYPDSFTMD